MPELTPTAQAVYDELNGRRSLIDGIDDDIVADICESVAAEVLRAHNGR
jgi:hypothetical protein